MVYWQNLTIVSRESTKIFCRTCTFVWCINKCYCHDGGIKLLMWRKKGIERQECPDSFDVCFGPPNEKLLSKYFPVDSTFWSQQLCLPIKLCAKTCIPKLCRIMYLYKPKNFFLLHLRVIVEIINQSKAAHFTDFVETSFYTAFISFQIHSGHLGVNLV